MEITKKDRVLLINQYRILAALNTEEAAHYNELISILAHGYKIFYSMIDEWVSDDMPSEESKLVIDILNIYRALENLKRVNKSELLHEHCYSYFKGFDGNNETEYMVFSRFLINEQRKFAEQQPYLSKNDSLNSHSPMIEKYKRMVQKWKELGEGWELDENQALQIMSA